MANRFEGTATFSGSQSTLDLLYVVTQRLEECASLSKLDGDDNWLPHIFKDHHTDDGIFCDDCYRQGNSVVMQISTVSTDGCEFFRSMSAGLGVNVTWQYAMEYSTRTKEVKFSPGSTKSTWRLWSEQELDAGCVQESTGDTSEATAPNSFYGIRLMHLMGEIDSEPEPSMGLDTPHLVYFHCKFAVCLAQQFAQEKAEINDVFKARICSDISIVALLTIQYATSISNTLLSSEAIHRISKLNADIRRLPFVFSSLDEMQYTNYLSLYPVCVSYQLMLDLFTNVKVLASMVFPVELYSPISMLNLPESLW